jgi:hypothetical protein
MPQVRNSDPHVQHWPSEVPSPEREKMVRAARAGWRELGFWYGCDWQAERWSFRADPRGLRAFAALLRNFAADPLAVDDGDHFHVGPYASLRLAYGASPALDRRGFTGSRDDFEGLVHELEQLWASESPSPQEFARNFTGAAGFHAVLVVEPEGFDPASADAAIAEEPEA